MQFIPWEEWKVYGEKIAWSSSQKDGYFMSEPAYKFTDFNGRSRLCLGKDFAYYQTKYVATTIIFGYHVKVVENHLVVPKLALTIYIKHGLKVNLHRRCDEETHKYLKLS